MSRPNKKKFQVDSGVAHVDKKKRKKSNQAVEKPKKVPAEPRTPKVPRTPKAPQTPKVPRTPKPRTRKVHVPKMSKDESLMLKWKEAIEEKKTAIKQCFFFDMPKDFYDFWILCNKLNPSSPENAFQKASLRLAGPYDMLNGSIDSDQPRSFYQVHDRYYYDVPEFQSVIAAVLPSQFHLGYFRDDPTNKPSFVGSNSGTNSTITMLGDNLFAAIYWYLDELLPASGANKGALHCLIRAIKTEAEMSDYSLDKVTPAMKNRLKNASCKGWHEAGIVVPISNGGVGYREIPETSASLKKLFADVCLGKPTDELEHLLNLVNFANDECDYGMGLELGLSMLCFGGDKLHPFIKVFLALAYECLGRLEFKDILLAHLDQRLLEGE